MKYLKDVIVRKRPLPSSESGRDGDEPEQISDFLDLEAVRARLLEPDGAQDRAPMAPADPPRKEVARPASARSAAATCARARGATR